MSAGLPAWRCHRALRVLALLGWWLLVLAPLAPLPAPAADVAAVTATMPGCHVPQPDAPDIPVPHGHACHCPAMSGSLLDAAAPPLRLLAAPVAMPRFATASDGIPSQPFDPPLRPPAA